jgi:hypothetical protein
VTKYCAYHGDAADEVKEEVGSLELRIFLTIGKICLYFHSLECMVLWFNTPEGKKWLAGAKSYEERPPT